MSEIEDNEIDDSENKDEQILNDDNYLLSKERPSEASKNTDYFNQQNNRFTIIDTNFDNQEESNRPSDISKNERPSNNSKNDDDNNIINQNENRNSNRKTNRNSNRNSNRKTNSLKNVKELKIIILGDVSVGKTSIISRYVNNSFTEQYKCSINAEKHTKLIDVDLNTSVKMIIWDTVGQEKFRALTRQYYSNSHGAIIVFDLTQKKTFDNIFNWIEDLHTNVSDKIQILIMGNKSDLSKDREVPMDIIKKKIGNKYLYFDASAKNGNNIVLAFDKIRTQILNNLNDDNDIRYNMNPRDTKELDNLGKIVNEKSSKCC